MQSERSPRVDCPCVGKSVGQAAVCSSRVHDLMAESGWLPLCLWYTRELSAMPLAAWLLHLCLAASSPCPPHIDLIWPGDKARSGRGLGIRWPFPPAWLISLLLGRAGPRPAGQAKVNPVQSPVLCGASIALYALLVSHSVGWIRFWHVQTNNLMSH